MLMNIAWIIEPILCLLALYLYSRSTVEARSLTFRLYLSSRIALSTLLASLALLTAAGGPFHSGALWLYEHFFWMAIVFEVVLSISVTRGLLSKQLSSLVGLQRLALLSFHWILLVGVLVLLDHVLMFARTAPLIAQLQVLGFGMAMTELVLLLFVTLFLMVVLRTGRSRYQDMAFGFAIFTLAAGVFRFGAAAPLATAPGPADTAAVVLTMLGLLYWILCFAGRERISKPMMLPATSPLLIWSEKLSVLKKGTPQ